ncbi:hypothetical protein ABZW11_15090 [Nonomuraea sp. NPDC004580]
MPDQPSAFTSDRYHAVHDRVLQELWPGPVDALSVEAPSWSTPSPCTYA